MTLSDAWVDFLAGWCSGAAAVVVCQPVDTILTRMQAGVVAVGVSTGTAGTAGTAAHHSRTLLETAGFSALWRGASPMITAVPLQNALLMGGYGVGQKYAAEYSDSDPSAPEKHKNKHKLAAVLVGGTVGGILQSFLMSPVEFIKVSQQCAVVGTGGGVGQGVTSTHTSTSAMSAVYKMFTQSNSTGMWRRGLGATLLRDGLPHGVWFATYEVTKQELTAYYRSVRADVHLQQNQSHNSDNNSISRDLDLDDTSVEEQVLVPLVAGAWAATAAWTVGYPADLIKTRIQAGTAQGQGIMGTAAQLIREANGSVVTGLYRGFGLKLLRSVPASMIGFSVYEYVKKQIERNL
jgi:solute carrier family 25 carnitine/acylcarnitine transporter 20/29